MIYSQNMKTDIPRNPRITLTVIYSNIYTLFYKCVYSFSFLFFLKKKLNCQKVFWKFCQKKLEKKTFESCQKLCKNYIFFTVYNIILYNIFSSSQTFSHQCSQKYI